MARMQRLQIYLDREMNEELAGMATKRGTSISHIVRLAVRRYLNLELNAEDPILGIIGMGVGEPGRVSEEHDRILTFSISDL